MQAINFLTIIASNLMNRKTIALTGSLAVGLAVFIGFVVSESNKRWNVLRNENIAKAKDCLKQEELCDKESINFNWLPDEMSRNVSTVIQERSRREERREKLLKDAEICIVLGYMDDCRDVDKEEVSKIDAELGKKLNDAIWSAKQKEMEERRKEEERIAREKSDKEEFDRMGWVEQEQGIFVRWCKNDCSKAGLIGDGAYALMEVWCRDRACGDIYAQANFVKNGSVIGWTNDTLYLDYGQKGVLTFQKYGLSGGGSAELVKFSANRY